MGFECQYCGSKLLTVKSLKRHIETSKRCIKSRDEGVLFAVCGFKYYSKKVLLKHKNNCTICLRIELKSIEESKEKNKPVVNTYIGSINYNYNNKEVINLINNPNFNLSIPPNLNRKDFGIFLDKNLTVDMIEKGEERVGELISENFIDNEGRYTVGCTNYRDCNFAYNNGKGKIIEDKGGIKLKKTIDVTMNKIRPYLSRTNEKNKLPHEIMNTDGFTKVLGKITHGKNNQKSDKCIGEPREERLLCNWKKKISDEDKEFTERYNKMENEKEDKEFIKLGLKQPPLEEVKTESNDEEFILSVFSNDTENEQEIQPKKNKKKEVKTKKVKTVSYAERHELTMKMIHDKKSITKEDLLKMQKAQEEATSSEDSE